MKKLLYFLFFISILLASACGTEITNAETFSPIEADIVVMDMNGKPIQNYPVNLSGLIAFPQTILSNSKGVASFRFNWSSYDGSNWYVAAKEDSVLNMVNFIGNPIKDQDDNVKYIIKDTIRMDTLKPIKIRVVVPRNDFTFTKFSVFKEGKTTTPELLNTVDAAKQTLKKQYYAFVNLNKPNMDTIITTKVLANNPFKIEYSVFINQNARTVSQTLEFDRIPPPDSVILVRID